jgi:hypothetical protein
VNAHAHVTSKSRPVGRTISGECEPSRSYTSAVLPHACSHIVQDMSTGFIFAHSIATTERRSWRQGRASVSWSGIPV